MSPDQFAYLIAPALAFTIAAGSPGPATLSVAATSMAHGRRSGMVLGLGLSFGLGLWGIVAAAGLGTLMLAWAPAMVLLRLAGGAYLLYLAWRSAQSALAASAPGGRAITEASAVRLFRRGLLLNALNPKAVLAWTAVIGIGLPAGAGSSELIAIVSVCVLIGIALYILYAAIFSMPPVMSAYAKARRGVEAFFALAFGIAGLRLVLARGSTP